MNLINQIMNSESNKKVGFDKPKIEKICECEECTNFKTENQIVEYPSLSDEEIEQIIKERYDYKDEKTKTFIRKALRIHGDRYDYSNSVYTKAIEYVEIICRVEGHKPFPQTPNNHLQGQGCPICRYIKSSQKQKSTIEEFIEKANKKHGVGSYDYSKVKYINNFTKVTIICPKHGEFTQTPDCHLQGQGCPICRYIKSSEHQKSNINEFIEKANKIHGEGTYDYSKVIYINCITDVTIICPKHGEFTQKPVHHLQGKGCSICGGTKKLTTKGFIEKANDKHGVGTYNYSKVKYINNYTKVIIICPIHGEFKQRPHDHLNGQGCSKCKTNYKGEITIRNFLIENKIEFEEQKRFEDCKDSKPLPFDFYLPKYNLCIEFDGIQHFKPIKRSYKMTDNEVEKNFKYIQKHDQIKNEYCKNNGIGLLRFNNFKIVKEDIIKYFQDNNLFK